MRLKYVILIVVTFFLSFVSSVQADNVISASDTISNPILSDAAKGRIESGTHTITFTTVQNIDTGAVRILIPAATKTITANDALPDTGSDIISSGFDLNGIEPQDITCSGGTVTWGQATVTASVDAPTEKHEILCPYSGILKQNTLVQILIGAQNRFLINPEAVSSHAIGSSDEYHVEVRLLDQSSSIVDRINIQVALTEQIEPSFGVGVSVTVGGENLIIYGYSSPRATITIDGPTIKATTEARKDGYFIFSHLVGPTVEEETCLRAKDTTNIFSSPVCIIVPAGNTSRTIGPVIIAPTIRLNKGEFKINEKGFISGQTMPNSKVSFSLYTDNRANPYLASISLVKPVEAFSFSDMQTISDQYGRYTLLLPTNNPLLLRMFTNSVFNNHLSPKSNTLSAKIVPWWVFLLLYLIIPLLLLASLIIAGILLYQLWMRFFHPYRLSRDHYLALVPDQSLVLTEHNIVLTEHELLSITEHALMRRDD